MGAVPAGEQPGVRPTGVDRDRVHGLRVEVGTLVELPGATSPAPDEQTLAGAHGEQYLGHADHLRDVVLDVLIPDTSQCAPHH